jgi:hypothetical protein
LNIKINNEPILNDLSNLEELTNKPNFNGGKLNESNEMIDSKNKIISPDSIRIDGKENILVKTELNGIFSNHFFF